MIRFDGYYVGTFHKVTDSRSDDNWFSRSALIFLKSKNILWSTKYFNNKKEANFILSEFKSEGNYTYKITGKEICQLIYENHPILEEKIYFDINSENELQYRNSDEIMTFVPWNSNE